MINTSAETRVLWAKPPDIEPDKRLGVLKLAKLITRDMREQAKRLGVDDKAINSFLDGLYLDSGKDVQVGVLCETLINFATDSSLAVAVRENGEPVGVIGGRIGRISLLATALPDRCTPEAVASQLVESFLAEKTGAYFETEASLTIVGGSPACNALLSHGFKGFYDEDDSVTSYKGMTVSSLSRAPFASDISTPQK